MTFGQFIKYLRKKKLWTAISLIRNMNINLSPSYIAQIENNGEIPSPRNIIVLLKAFGLDKEAIKEWIEVAKQEKIAKFTHNLDKEYKEATERK